MNRGMTGGPDPNTGDCGNFPNTMRTSGGKMRIGTPKGKLLAPMNATNRTLDSVGTNPGGGSYRSHTGDKPMK